MDKIVYKFNILYSGWELDEYGYIKQGENGKNYLELTSHGKAYKAELFEITNKIKEYEDAIRSTQKAVNLLVNQ